MKNNWRDNNSCRNLFIKYAEDQGFDPYQPENWYKASLLDLKDVQVNVVVNTSYLWYGILNSQKGGLMVSKAWGGYRRALMAAFPELRFDRWGKGEFLFLFIL